MIRGGRSVEGCHDVNWVLSQAVDHLHDYYGEGEKASPFMAIAFRQDQMYFQDRGVMRISRGEEPSEDVLFWNALLTELKATKQEMKEPQKFRAGITYHLLPDKVQTGHGVFGATLVSVGYAPGSVYWDTDMYDVDDWGWRVMETGLKHDVQPFWAVANYPAFREPSFMGDVGFGHEGLVRTIENVKRELNSQPVSVA